MKSKPVFRQASFLTLVMVSFVLAGCVGPSGSGPTERDEERQTSPLTRPDLTTADVVMHGCVMGLVSIDAEATTVRNMVPSRYASHSLLGTGAGAPLWTNLR